MKFIGTFQMMEDHFNVCEKQQWPWKSIITFVIKLIGLNFKDVFVSLVIFMAPPGIDASTCISVSSPTQRCFFCAFQCAIDFFYPHVCKELFRDVKYHHHHLIRLRSVHTCRNNLTRNSDRNYSIKECSHVTKLFNPKFRPKRFINMEVEFRCKWVLHPFSPLPLTQC